MRNAEGKAVFMEESLKLICITEMESPRRLCLYFLTTSSFRAFDCMIS
jgi:hypothetical protein